MLYGYARDTNDHDLDFQLAALSKACCDSITTETSKGIESLEELLSRASRGDSVVVWRLDKAADSVSELNSLFKLMKERGVSLRSLHERVDTVLDTEKLTQEIISKMVRIEQKSKSLP